MSGDGSSGEVFEGAVGIDLGTTYSCVAVFLNDQTEVIPNEQGNRTTPSCVAFSGEEVLVGDGARNLAARGAPNVVFDAKRMIGRRADEKEFQEDARRWPFATAVNADGRVCMEVEFKGEKLQLAPEVVSAKVLAYLRHCAERHLGKRVTKAVITVPAYFNDSQRQATKDAAGIAGLEVLRIINEPTAAALCYGLGTPTAAAAKPPTPAAATAGPTNVLVFDLGGGTFDVSVITIDSGIFSVRATAGDTHLGGQDVDHALVGHVLAELRARHGVEVAPDNARLLGKVKAACERAKRVLSFSSAEELALDGVLPGGGDFVLQLSRAKLEELCEPLFKRCLAVVQQALKDAKMAPPEITHVVLVGGSSRIPKLQEMLAGVFGPDKLCSAVHPDEAVAVGAAIQASVLSADPQQQSERTAPVVLVDVVPLSIGVEVDDGKFDVVIPRNTAIPYLATKEYSTVEDNQRDVDIVVYEGERRLTKHNHRLGAFSLEGITRARRGEPTITVTFSVDADGLLTVTGEEALARKTRTLTVRSAERLTETQVAEMVALARRFEAADAREEELHARGSRLAAALDALEADVAALGGGEPSGKLAKKLRVVPHARKWIAETLPTYASAAEADEKLHKIMQLVAKAHKRARKEAKSGGGGGGPHKRQRTEDGSRQDADNQSDSSNDDDDDDDSGAD